MDIIIDVLFSLFGSFFFFSFFWRVSVRIFKLGEQTNKHNWLQRGGFGQGCCCLSYSRHAMIVNKNVRQLHILLFSLFLFFLRFCFSLFTHYRMQLWHTLSLRERERENSTIFCLIFFFSSHSFLCFIYLFCLLKLGIWFAYEEQVVLGRTAL